MSLKRSASPAVEDTHKKRGRPLNSTRIVSALQTTMTLSNIELDLPDTPRPFEVVNTIPLSVEKPQYDDTLGENLLSVKDSATLYNSLIISRQNWLYNDQMGVFKQYWSRRDDAIEKANQEALNGSSDGAAGQAVSGQASTNDLGTSKRKNMNKLCECALQLGPHIFDVRLFIVKNDQIEKKYSDDQKAEEEKTGVKVKEEEEDDSDNDADNDENQAKDKDQDGKNENEDKSELDDATENEERKDIKMDEIKKEHTEANDSKKKSEPKGTEKSSNTKVKPSAKNGSMKANTIPAGARTEEVKKIEIIADKGKESSPEAKPIKREIQQSLENHIMIANLNSLARANTSLNDLMKTVASGSANTKQIAEFQKYIVKAKEMGDPSGSHAKAYNLQIKQQKAELRAAEKKVKNDEKAKQALERQKMKDAKREARRIEKEKEKELKQQDKKRKRLIRQKEREATQIKKKKDPSFKINKTKLTALQERYLENATLSFEFSENTSARYLLPKNCVMEKLDNGDILISFIVIHNYAEIAAYEEEEEEQQRQQREAERKLESETALPAEEIGVPKKTTHKRKRSRFGPTRKASTRNQKEPEPEPVVKPVRPVPVYSTMTAKLLEAPPHCVPLILNSADPLEKVQEEMTEMFNEGHRQEVDYVWYQLDGITDEVLAEALRSNLTTLEAQNVKRTGGTGRRKAAD